MADPPEHRNCDEGAVKRDAEQGCGQCGSRRNSGRRRRRRKKKKKVSELSLDRDQVAEKNLALGWLATRVVLIDGLMLIHTCHKEHTK